MINVISMLEANELLPCCRTEDSSLLAFSMLFVRRPLSAQPPSSLPAPTMAAAATAPKMRNVLASLDQQTLQLIIEALPIAQGLHAADNLRFAPLRQELLGLYGDDAAPNLLSPALLPCANRAAKGWWTRASCARSSTKWLPPKLPSSRRGLTPRRLCARMLSVLTARR